MYVTIFTIVSYSNVKIHVLSDLCTGTLINISVEASIIDVRDDVLTKDVVDIGIIDTPVGVGVIVTVASVVIDSEFPMYASCVVDVLVDVLTAANSDDVTIIVTASGIGVDMLADVDANAFAAGMADLNFIVPTPLTGSAPFC